MTNCPTMKVAYVSRREAITFSRTMRLGDMRGRLRPYPCECGYWHLTSMSKTEVKKVKKKGRKSSSE